MAFKILAIALMAAGVLGLVYGSFSYTEQTHEVKLGPIELSVKDKQTINVPVWTGVGGNSGWRRAPAFWKQEEIAAAPVAV
jgi:hypothetical protein